MKNNRSLKWISLCTIIVLMVLALSLSFSIPGVELWQPALAGAKTNNALDFQFNLYLPIAVKNPYWLLHEFLGYTYDAQYLEFSPSSPWQGIRFVKVETIYSPSWISWREVEIISDDQNIALGKPAVASISLYDHPPSMAVNGLFEDWWGSGDFAPQWIEIDLQASYTISKIRLATSQSPEGETLHRVWGRGQGD